MKYKLILILNDSNKSISYPEKDYSWTMISEYHKSQSSITFNYSSIKRQAEVSYNLQIGRAHV